ncbi:MAG: ABC transporter permease [Verrucomicrobia bacterium]|nr:ABC transporter permease [Verrucomicrobiota bacterium]
MRNVPTLLRREMNACFASVLGYVVLVFLLVVMGFVFCSSIADLLASGTTQITVMRRFFYWFWLPSLFVIPAITMRLLAEEKRSGTIEMLMTAPVTDFEVVLAKWLGAVVLYGLMWGLTGLYVLILRKFTGGLTSLDFGPIASGYLGVLLIGQFLIAVGVLTSSLTKNQVVAFLISFALVFLFVIGIWFGEYFARGTTFGKLFEYISCFTHMEEFARGIVDVRTVVLYLSASFWVLFVTTRVVESRKWR